MGHHTRTYALLVGCAILIALGLSACGGGDDTSSTPTAAPTTAESTESAEEGQGESTGAGSEKQSTGGGGETSGEGSGVGGSNVQPGERSAKFVTPGGDNSIQEFGGEGDAAERAEALKVIEAVTTAGEKGDWAEVCDKYISAKNIEQFEVVAEKIPKFKGASCAEILNGLSPGGTANSPSKPKGPVASIRNDGENAFAIYNGVDGNAYAWPMAVENGGALKVTALAPTPLNPG